MQASEDSVALVKASGGWEHIDVALRSIVKQRGLLDVNEAKWLREALRVKLWREVGCVSMIDYMERRLGYAPRTASDRIRVAFTLEELPKIAAALGNGLPYSAARELTRVATAENEQTWLDAVRGKTVHEIEGMVSGRGRGANPDDPAHPSLVGRTLPFEGVRPATEALVRDARRMLQDERGGGAVITDDEVLASFARAVLEGGERERMKAPYQVAVTLCERCGRGWQDSGGRRFELSSADIDRACCDAEHIGSLDADDPERATQDVTPAKRRLVRRRDKGRCRVPGCRSTRCLEIHHIVGRILGGSHELENILLVCDSCHAALHRGLITISGTSANLIVTRRHEVAFDVEPTTDENAHVGTSAAHHTIVLLSAPPDHEITPPTDAEQAKGIGRHGPSARVGTSVSHHSEPQVDEMLDRDAARSAGCTSVLAYRADQVDEPVRRDPSAHVGTNVPQQSASRPSAQLSKFEHERLRADARSALIDLGYRAGEAGKAVDAVMRSDEGTIDEILREALRFLLPRTSS